MTIVVAHRGPLQGGSDVLAGDKVSMAIGEEKITARVVSVKRGSRKIEATETGLVMAADAGGPVGVS